MIDFASKTEKMGTNYSITEKFGANLAELLAEKIGKVYPEFDAERFIQDTDKLFTLSAHGGWDGRTSGPLGSTNTVFYRRRRIRPLNGCVLRVR